MLGITEEMMKEIRTALSSDSSLDAYIPLPNMGGYYVSRVTQEAGSAGYMFPATVDGVEVHIYMRF